MAAGIAPLEKRPAWKALETHHQQIRELHLRKIFADDPQRGERLCLVLLGVHGGSNYGRMMTIEVAEEEET